MGQGIPELWSAADEAATAALAQAIADNALLGALTAIEGLDEDAQGQVKAHLEDLEAEVFWLLEEGADALTALTDVLVRAEGLTGATDNYHHPDNSLLSRVLKRRQGQPILLSAIWMLVGRRAEVPVVGIPLPGHFVVRVGAQLADPFHEGAALSEETCRTIALRAMPGATWDPQWLEPASTRTIATRVVRNLVNACRQVQDATGHYRAVRLLAALSPGEPAVLLEQARLTEEFGAYRLAAQLYQRIADSFEGSREGRIASIRSVEIGARTRVLN